MKHIGSRRAGLVVLALLLLFLYRFFHVSGRDIKPVSEISDACTVKIIKYRLGEWDARTEYQLRPEQLPQLKALLLDSTFTRTLSAAVYFDDHELYDIQIDFNNQQDFLSIHCIGNAYISVTNQFGGHHLKNNRSDWKASLETLIAEAERLPRVQ